MVSRDPLADMFSAIKNAAKAEHEEVIVSHSNLKEQLARLLKEEGFISEVRKFKEKGRTHLFLAIKLAYDEKGRSKIRHLKRISRSGQRIYSPADELRSPPVGIKIISTSRGLLTEKEARKRQLGGEVIAEVW